MPPESRTLTAPPLYGRIAPVYHILERLLWGRHLQDSRARALPFIDSESSLLLLGDGDGRFSTLVHQRFPLTRIVSLEISQAMNRLATKRRHKAGIENLSYLQVQEDLRLWSFPESAFQTIVAQFVFDSLTPTEIQTCARKLFSSIKPEGTLIITDFVVPTHIPARIRAQVSEFLMFAFFRNFCRLKTKRLYDYWSIFEDFGFILKSDQYNAHACIKTTAYCRPEA